MSISDADIERFANLITLGGNMTIYERQQLIMKYLNENHFATVKELSLFVYSSEASVRRDIKSLADKGYLEQIYGGVVIPEYANGVVPLHVRDSSNSAVKEEIAKRAAKEVFDGATIIMDGSSTVRRMLKYINASYKITVLTNNARILNEHIPSNVTVYATGGLFLSSNNIFVGSGADNFLRSVNADLLFFSSQALSLEGEISDASEEETSLRKTMISRSKRKIFLCDSSKVGEKRTFSVCTKNEIDMIICDKELPWENE